MKIKQYVQKLLLTQGLFVCERTSDKELKEYFEIARPISINKELIRIGCNGDGGYLLPDDLDNIEACFSPGVGEDNPSFEEDMAHRGIKSFMADYSVSEPSLKNNSFNFEKKFLGDTNDNKYIRLKDWVQSNSISKEKDLLLQMDVEGAEYLVILDTPIDILKRFRIMVIEFHDMKMVFSKHTFPFVKKFFKKLTREFFIVHIHPNNYCPVFSSGNFDVPDVLEFTFYRKDRVKKSERRLVFPHALDRPNTKKKKDIILPECWR